MKIAQMVLRVIHPRAERERQDLRMVMARATAEAEDVTRTIRVKRKELTKYLSEHFVSDGKNGHAHPAMAADEAEQDTQEDTSRDDLPTGGKK